MTLSRIRSQVEALCRKYATELEVYRLGKVTVEFCNELAEALLRPKSGPAKAPWDWNRVLLGRMRDRGFSTQYRFRPGRIMAVHDYLKRCPVERRVLPRPAKSCAPCCPGPPPAASSPAP